MMSDVLIEETEQANNFRMEELERELDDSIALVTPSSFRRTALEEEDAIAARFLGIEPVTAHGFRALRETKYQTDIPGWAELRAQLPPDCHDHGPTPHD